MKFKRYRVYKNRCLRKLRLLRATLQRLIRKLRRPRTRKKAILIAGIIGVLLVAGSIYKANQEIDPTAYSPLLSVIAKGESNGNYNAYFGNAGNTNVRFTEMSLEQVLQWQTDFVAAGNASSAVGKYQIIRPTLSGLVRKLKLDPKTPFDKATQDQLAIALLERRGAKSYVSKKLSREQFAANLAQEWAALPRITGANPQQSYYAGDGLNVSRVSIDEMYRALEKLSNFTK